MLQRISYLILLIVFLPLLSFAQKAFSIEGVVFCEMTGLPLSNVKITNQDNKQVIMTTQDGRYKFDSLTNKNYTISVKSLDTAYFQIDTIVGSTSEIERYVNINLKIKVGIACEYYIKKASEDIRNKDIKLMYAFGLIKGIRKVPYKDVHFQEKYNVKYSSEGCTGSGICDRAYNKIIGEYLTKTYGKRWKSKVRKDVLF